MKKSAIFLSVLLVLSVSYFPVNNAYAVDAVYHDYTSLVPDGAEPFGIECSADNFAYMTTFAGGSGGLLKINKTDATQATFVSEPSGADWFSVESDTSGNLFINERDNGLAWKYVESTGIFTKIPIVELLTSVSGVTITYPDPNNPININIDVLSTGSNPDYQLNTNLGGHAGEVQYANGFIWISVNYAIDLSVMNTLHLTEKNNIIAGNPNAVEFYGLAKIDPSTGTVTEMIDLSVSGATDVRGIATDGNYLWLTSQNNDKVLKFDTVSETVVENIDLTADSEPRGITVHDDYIFVALNKAVGGNSEVLRINKTDTSSRTVIDTGAINDSGGTFSVFTSNSTVIWTDQSGNTGSFAVTGDSRVVTDTSANTSSNHYGCQVGDKFWFAGKGSVKTGIVTIGSGTPVSSSSSSSDDSNGSGNQWNSRPTMGLSHQTGNQLVDFGFFRNDVKYPITDNFYTPTEKIPIVIGESNHFGLKTYVGDAQVMVGEISLVPEVGAFGNAEVRLESHFNFDKTLKDVKVFQKDFDIDEKIITSYQKPVDCIENSNRMDCVYVGFDNVIFREKPVFEKVALNVIDDNRRYQVTYLNDGFSFTGVDSLNQPKVTSAVIEKGQLQKLTLTDKKLNLWSTDAGIVYWKNDFGTFIRQTPYEVILSPESPVNVMERNHSEFGKLKEYAMDQAVREFDSKSIQGKDKGYFTYDFPSVDYRTQFLIDNNLLHLRD